MSKAHIKVTKVHIKVTNVHIKRLYISCKCLHNSQKAFNKVTKIEGKKMFSNNLKNGHGSHSHLLKQFDF